MEYYPMGISVTPAATPLKRGSLSDPFTNSLYAFAPYRGCGHGCRYCDGRAEKYYVEGDFEQDLTVRRDLPERLAQALMKEREIAADGRRCLVSGGSGVTDIYQPIEESEQLTRKCAGIFAGGNNPDFNPFPVLVLTKSSLILRDLDLWEKVHNRRGFILLLTITPMTEDQREIFEPGASTIDERWETAAVFRAAGIPVGILAMPILPFLTDGKNEIRNLYSKAADIGVSFVAPGGLTLRSGRQKDLFLDTLSDPGTSAVEKIIGDGGSHGYSNRKGPAGFISPAALERNVQGDLHLTRLRDSYEKLYGENRLSGSPRSSWRYTLHALIENVAKETGMPHLLPHKVYRRMVPDYEGLYILFTHMKELYASRRINTNPLLRASEKYAFWLKEQRTILRRRRTLPGDSIDTAFDALFTGSGIEQILENRKLAAFTRTLREGAVFDYSSLTLD